MSGYEVKQLLEFADRHEASLVHIYFGSEAARVLGYLRRERRPKVVSFHGADVSEDVTQEELKAVFSTVDLVLCRSQSLADVLLSRGCPPDLIRLNRTGVPVAGVLPHRAPPQSGEAMPLRCLQACRFIEKKGLLVSVGAMALLRDKGRPIHLTLAGDGPERPRVEGLIESFGLQSHVTFTGFLTNEQLLELMPEHDVFLHPSLTTASGDQEGIPNSLLEAMGQGLPVVATRHGGIPEVIEDGVHGLLVPVADEQLVADAVERMAVEPQLFLRIRENAYERVKREYSLDRCRIALQKHYHEAVVAGERRVRNGLISRSH